MVDEPWLDARDLWWRQGWGVPRPRGWATSTPLSPMEHFCAMPHSGGGFPEPSFPEDLVALCDRRGGSRVALTCTDVVIVDRRERTTSCHS
jgi:hypothetical protein